MNPKSSSIPTPLPPKPSEFLEFLYILKDDLDSENQGAFDILDRVRDLVYERIQILEMQEWSL